MNMNQTPSKNSPDHGFNGFMFGLTLGVLGALLLGTEEGRKITKQALDALPENFKKMPNLEPKEHVRDFTPPISTPEQTPHHAYATPAFEAPPPPAPPSHFRPEYFSSGTK
jgi:hypothetical protein